MITLWNKNYTNVVFLLQYLTKLIFLVRRNDIHSCDEKKCGRWWKFYKVLFDYFELLEHKPCNTARTDLTTGKWPHVGSRIKHTQSGNWYPREAGVGQYEISSGYSMQHTTKNMNSLFLEFFNLMILNYVLLIVTKNTEKESVNRSIVLWVV